MEQAAAVTRRRKRKEHSRRPGAPRVWEVSDITHGIIIGVLIVAAPWMFGCTEDWAMRLMNWGCGVSGALALLLRWKAPPEFRLDTTFRELAARRAFLAINLLLLAFCATAYLNARATFSIEQQAFTYREGVIPWLPTTYDANLTVRFLINCAAWFSFFWSARSWIGRAQEGRETREGEPGNKRVTMLLWVFTVNGFLVALQGLLQRLSGSSKLLWFRVSYYEEALANFGPFSYRGNAVDYLNMVWPVTFGLWYLLTHRKRSPAHRFGDGPELLLLPMFLVTLIASFATVSRGGVLVAIVLILALLALLFLSKINRQWKVGLAAALAVVFVAAFGLFGKVLTERFRALSTDKLSGRTEIYDNAAQMADDFPWFGSGPGTFMSIYYLYRQTPDQPWAAFLHDDWLETRVTFGRIGLGIVVLQLLLLFWWSFAARERWLSRVLQFCLYLSLIGCLAHAKGDFPFQTYGVVFTFIVVSVLATSSVVPMRVKAASELGQAASGSQVA